MNKKFTNKTADTESIDQAPEPTDQHIQSNSTDVTSIRNEEEATNAATVTEHLSMDDDTPFVPKFTDLQRKQLDEQLRNVNYFFFKEYIPEGSIGQRII